MALYRPGPAIGIVSGRLGGAIAKSGPAGPQLTNRPQRKRSTSRRGDRWRSVFTLAQRTWRTLTNDERAAWRAYARDFTTTNRVGLQRPRSAFNMFVQALALHLLIDGTIPADLNPLMGRIPPADSITATAGEAGGLDLDANVSAPLVNPFGAWFVARSFRGYLPASFGTYRFLVAQTLSGPFDYTTEYEALYGPIRQGDVISVRFVQHLLLGRPHDPLQLDLIATA